MLSPCETVNGQVRVDAPNERKKRETASSVVKTACGCLRKRKGEESPGKKVDKETRGCPDRDGGENQGVVRRGSLSWGGRRCVLKVEESSGSRQPARDGKEGSKRRPTRDEKVLVLPG
jgi:hypothetical protein